MNLETPTKEATVAVLDLSENSPKKEKTKSTVGVIWMGNQYTTKGFNILLPLMFTPTPLPTWKPPSA